MLTLGTLLALGCGPGNSADTDGDPTEGGSSGDGGGISPTAACAAYLECATVVSPGELGMLLDAYGPEGSCWESTQDVADQCDEACANGLAQLMAAAPNEPACVEPSDDGADETGGDDGIEPIDRAVDLIFVIDNSGSMGEEQGTITAAVDGLIGPIVGAGGVDLRVGVTTTDNGNFWCPGTTPEAGSFVSTSCRSRQDDFVFAGAIMVDATQEACLDVCDSDTVSLGSSWLEIAADGTNNVGGGLDPVSALRCILPQGINGCGFEQQLSSMSKATQANAGFRRDNALLAIVIVTDEADCSIRSEAETIFMPEGDRAFWSLPEEPTPTSAVCWNAGVECTGSGNPYTDCVSQNYAADGGLAATPADAVMRPVSEFIDEFAGESVYIAAVAGVGSSGDVVYAESADPQFGVDFGIGPGCTSAAGEAVPPVRVRELVEQLGGNLFSICEADASGLLGAIGDAIVARLP